MSAPRGLARYFSRPAGPPAAAGAGAAAAAPPGPAVVDLVSDDEDGDGAEDRENDEESAAGDERSAGEAQQEQQQEQQRNKRAEEAADDDVVEIDVDDGPGSSKPASTSTSTSTSKPPTASLGRARKTPPAKAASVPSATVKKANKRAKQPACAQWGALLSGSTKKFAGVADDSIVTAVLPSERWGMVVDAKWRADFVQLTNTERNVQQTLRYLGLEAGAPFTPAFAFADGISEQAFRPPGSGSYAFDRLRSARWADAPAPTWQLCAPNLFVVIRAYLALSRRALEGHLDPSVDELHQALTALVQREALREESISFRVIAALLYSRTRWVSEDQLVERWHLDKEELGGAIAKLKRAGHLRTSPANLADCLDLLNAQTRAVLLQLKPLQKCGLSSATKSQVLAHIADRGVSFARKVCQAIEARSIRLSDGSRGLLRRCLVHVFARTGYSSEETRYLLRHVSLADLGFAGSAGLEEIARTPLAVEACAKANSVNPAAPSEALAQDSNNVASRQAQEIKSETAGSAVVGESDTAGSNGGDPDAEEVSKKLRILQQREDYFKAVELSGKLSLYAAHGDTGGAYRILHEASSRLMKMLDGADAFQLRELHALARVCLTGCQLLERERRYADTEHYLRMVVQSTGHHRELVMVHCEALLRLVQDFLHRDSKSAALKLIEEALRRESWILGCALSPAKESPNRLGGTGIAIMSRCLRLSVPPRRWRLGVKDAAQVHAPRLIHISAERRDATSAKSSSDSATRFPAKPSWKTGSTVEDVVLEHFRRHGEWSGIHCENGFGITVYTLLFWDLIFDLDAPHAELASAFVELPRAAADGTWLEFPATRREVEKRIADIRDPANGQALVAELLTTAWASAATCHARGVNLERLSLEESLAVLSGLSLRVIAMICSLYAENYKAWNGGLPDLMLWRSTSGSDDGSPTMETRFIEVKGPGDSLSDRQRAWIDKLTQAGADIAVCHVEAVDDSASTANSNFAS